MNIKIGKGGSGKITSTKGGSGKLNEKKYIDLLPPNFISKVTLSGGTYSNGTYTRSSGGATTFNGPNGKYIEVYQLNNRAPIYSTYDPSFPEHPIVIYVSFDEGNTWIKENAGDVDAGTPPTSVIENALTFLFDPIFYNNIKDESPSILYGGKAVDAYYLNHSIRDYQYNNIVPQLGDVNAIQYVQNKPIGFKKSGFKNNTFSWIKDSSSNNDLENGKNDNFAGTMMYEDLLRPLLTLTKPGNTDLFSNSTTSTFICFVRLQNPITHKNPNNPSFLVREKRGFFAKIGNVEIGYRSPYYNIVGEPSYKGVFNNFSFVFNFGTNSYIQIHNSTFMTDFKFNFNQMYCIAIVKNNSEMKFYINGELQNMAYLKFNPLTNNPHCGIGGRPRRLYSSRRIDAPVGPGFKKTNGSVYNPTNMGGLTPISTNHSINCSFQGSQIIYGKSNMFRSWNPRGVKRLKRYLNNLDIGVNIAYNIALSQSQIVEIYENFRYRY